MEDENTNLPDDELENEIDSDDELEGEEYEEEDDDRMMTLN